MIAEQQNPFPFLVVTEMDNKVVVVHGICLLSIPLKYDHPHEGNLIAFLQDTFNEKALPKIFKLNERDYKEAKEWFHPCISVIMNQDPSEQDVLPSPETSEMVKTCKLISIATFLVPLLMNEGKPKAPIAMFQKFFDTFWVEAPPALKECTKHVFNFLLAAMGFDSSYEEDKPPISQLVIQAEELQVDPTLEKWGTHQFGSIIQLARELGQKDGTKENQESWNIKVDKGRKKPRKITQEPASHHQENLHKENQGQNNASTAMHEDKCSWEEEGNHYKEHQQHQLQGNYRQKTGVIGQQRRQFHPSIKK